MSPQAAPRQIHVVGIGAGDPRHLTLQALDALREVDVFLVAEKDLDTGADGSHGSGGLVEAREALLATHLEPGSYRILPVPDPSRGVEGRRDPADRAAYLEGVRSWHQARTDRYVEVLAGLEPGLAVGFLVWGDPAFYDSTIRVVDAIAERLPVSVGVVPGISAFQALAAAHGIVLHEVGEPVRVTTGRRLVEEWRAAHGASVPEATTAARRVEPGRFVVMLDGHLVCRELVSGWPDATIWWGACLGLPQQELRSGRLADVIDDIVATRARLRTEHGWVMDVYALAVR